ncbi:hypothetical protein BCR39DRAFT_460198, partial [Naematelia encephala]
MEELGLPNASRSFAGQTGRQLLDDERQFDHDALRREYDLGWAQANGDQQTAISTVTRALGNNHGGLFFLDGPGGTGKTFVERLMLA